MYGSAFSENVLEEFLERKYRIVHREMSKECKAALDSLEAVDKLSAKNSWKLTVLCFYIERV